MSIGEALRAYLLSKTEIAGIVGGRIYPVILPQDVVLPAISYQLITQPVELNVTGEYRRSAYFQIDCWAKNYLDAVSLCDKVESALNGYSGSMGSVNAILAYISARRDMHDETVEEYRAAVDTTIWF